jgi:uncharacterized protein affecting Mg2+/Co2+ transport
MAQGISRTQKYYWRNPEKHRAAARERRKNNPDRYKSYVRKYREKNVDAERARHLMREYGITVEQYNAMEVQQGGVCAICKQPETQERNGVKYRLAVDHCHKTGKVRGLLCFKCNSAMGSFEKRDVPLANVEKYLEVWR